ncbi:hypothetical protein E0H80_06170 [Acinetobacter sp. ANC 4779]|uniref:hypothetical protein n=1 Tax=Acinetobacter sp. ANC 4779 TaxID=2529848 RepID=UPI00103EEC79|nr:hypothetical protein [Acinetobacter sp. ANC 4779]TCB50952.1 hypothetical protein E0H80_06170 [Acinetobacter sp. ANC 4779]
MVINDLFDREYTQDYTCNEFACEAWERITGENLTERLNDYLNDAGSFEGLDVPISPCIAFFSRNPKSSTHVGLFYEGKILHLSPRGVQHIPLDYIMLGFKTVSFYK